MNLTIKESYENKIALVTGGSRGLGKHIINKLLSNGITVISTSRKFQFDNSTNIQDKKLIEQYLDVTNESSVNNLFSWIKSLNKELFVLVNNAGIGVFKSFLDIPLKEWELIIQTNLTGSFLCSREASKIMIQHGGGRIINIGSIADKLPLPFNTAYGVSKAGLRSLSAIVNEEYKFNKIRITHVCLGAVNTDIWDNREGFSTNDMLQPEVVADCITYLALLPLNVRLDNIEIFPEKGAL